MSLLRLGDERKLWRRRKRPRELVVGKALFDGFEWHALAVNGVGLAYLRIMEQGVWESFKVLRDAYYGV
jgi:hypothetical protein